MSEQNYMNYEVFHDYAVLSLSREKELNALNSQVLKELDCRLKQIDFTKIRCLILTGAGTKAFVAGADIGEMAMMTKKEAAEFSRAGSRPFRQLETVPIPTIAAVNGYALGGGCELSLACDIRICSEQAVFGFPEVSLGIMPGFGGTQRLMRTVGISKAKEMIYTARRIDAKEALRIGLVSAVLPQSELMDHAVSLAKKIAENSVLGVRNSKIVMN